MASTTFSGPVTSTNGFIGALTGNVTGNVAGSGSITHATTVAINATATATAAQVATGYITSTSAAATAITLPTGTLLGAGSDGLHHFYVCGSNIHYPSYGHAARRSSERGQGHYF